MTQHIIIRVEDYVAGTAEKPEVKVFTQAHATRRPTPWGRLTIGDTVWMKWSGGPIVAKGLVEGFRQMENCTPEVLRNSVGGTDLYHLDQYWHSLPPSFFAVAAFIGAEQWIVPPVFPSARSFGPSWIVLDSPRKEAEWLTDHGEEPIPRSQSSSPGKSRRTLRASVRFEVLRRENFTCRYCGRRPPAVQLHVDHVVPRSIGGTDEFSNLVAACADCNLGKSTKRIDGIVDA